MAPENFRTAQTLTLAQAERIADDTWTNVYRVESADGGYWRVFLFSPTGPMHWISPLGDALGDEAIVSAPEERATFDRARIQRGLADFLEDFPPHGALARPHTHQGNKFLMFEGTAMQSCAACLSGSQRDDARESLDVVEG